MKKFDGIRKANVIRPFSIISLFVEDFSYLRTSDSDHIDLLMDILIVARHEEMQHQASFKVREWATGGAKTLEFQSRWSQKACANNYFSAGNKQYGSLGQLAQQELFNKSRIFINSSLRVLPTIGNSGSISSLSKLNIRDGEIENQQGESQSRKVSNIPSWWV